MEEDLINRLRNCTSGTIEDCAVCPYQGGYKGTYCMNGLISEAADAIEELAKNSPKVGNRFGEWIPVTERPPKKNGVYLVYVYGEVTEMNYWHGKWHMLRDDYTKAVTHWMPLPQPPKES